MVCAPVIKVCGLCFCAFSHRLLPLCTRCLKTTLHIVTLLEAMEGPQDLEMLESLPYRKWFHPLACEWERFHQRASYESVVSTSRWEKYFAERMWMMWSAHMCHWTIFLFMSWTTSKTQRRVVSWSRPACFKAPRPSLLLSLKALLANSMTTRNIKKLWKWMNYDQLNGSSRVGAYFAMNSEICVSVLRSWQVTSTNPIDDGFYRTITSVCSKVQQHKHARRCANIQYNFTNQIIWKRIASVCAWQTGKPNFLTSILLPHIHKKSALTSSMQNPSPRTVSDKQSASVAKINAFAPWQGTPLSLQTSRSLGANLRNAWDLTRIYICFPLIWAMATLSPQPCKLFNVNA